jgi:hypothetical protein
MTPTLLVEVTRSIPPSSREPFEHFAHPIVTLVLHQYYSTRCMGITSKEGSESG